jgi:hypothetical protein
VGKIYICVCVTHVHRVSRKGLGEFLDGFYCRYLGWNSWKGPGVLASSLLCA